MDNYIAMKTINLAEAEKLSTDMVIPKTMWELIAFSPFYGHDFEPFKLEAKGKITLGDRPLIILGDAIDLLGHKANSIIKGHRYHLKSKYYYGIMYHLNGVNHTYVIVRDVNSIRELEKSGDI